MLSFLMLSSRSAPRPGAIPTASQNEIQRPIIAPASPVESTLPTPPASVHSKSLVVTRFPLESTLTRKPRGEGSIIVNETRDEACLSRTTIGSEGPLRSPCEAILSRAANGTAEILWGRLCQQSDYRYGPGSSGKEHRQPARISPELLVNRDFLTLAWFISFQQK
jgi:hypothetical protein